MARARIRWRPGVFREIRTLPAVQREVFEVTKGLLTEAGIEKGYVGDFGISGGRGRARGAVLAASYEARRDNAENHTLIRALGAIGRL